MSSITFLHNLSMWQSSFQQFNHIPTPSICDSNYEGSIDKTDASTVDNKFKTEMCNNWVTLLGTCKYETRCRFAHGKHELLGKKINNVFYKQKNCETFFSKGSCPYGSRCTFRHDERKLPTVLEPYKAKLTELKIQLKKNYDKFGFEESDPNSKTTKSKRLSIFNDITDDQISFDSRKIATKIVARKTKGIYPSIITQVI